MKRSIALARATGVFYSATLLLASAAAFADNAPPVPTQIVDLANEVDGVHPGYRAFHAKGVVVEGSFKASAEAARLSSATLFSGKPIPGTARFQAQTTMSRGPSAPASSSRERAPFFAVMRTALCPKRC
jgi:catalase